MFESAVVNASPLIYLGRTGNLHLIEGCARNVWVPDVVLDVPAARPLIDELIASGLYLSEEIADRALALVGE